MKICPNCSYQNDDSSLFCANCGKKLEELQQNNIDDSKSENSELTQEIGNGPFVGELVADDFVENSNQTVYNDLSTNSNQTVYNDLNTNSNQTVYNDLSTNSNQTVQNTLNTNPVQTIYNDLNSNVNQPPYGNGSQINNVQPQQPYFNNTQQVQGGVQGANTYNNMYSDKKINATPYVIWAIADLVCCCLPLGIAALIFAMQI